MERERERPYALVLFPCDSNSWVGEAQTRSSGNQEVQVSLRMAGTQPLEHHLLPQRVLAVSYNWEQNQKLILGALIWEVAP